MHHGYAGIMAYELSVRDRHYLDDAKRHLFDALALAPDQFLFLHFYVNARLFINDVFK